MAILKPKWLKIAQGWPDSVRQNLENPHQPDRLPSDAAVELEYPTYRFTDAQNRWFILRVLGWFAFWSLCVAGIAYLPQAGVNGIFYLSCVAVAGFYLFAITDLERNKPWWRWLVYFVAGPLITVALFTFIQPWTYLLVCIIALVRISDLFASHYFHLKTCAPLPRSRALTLRALWGKRHRSVISPAKGLEFYALAGLAVAGVLTAIFVNETSKPRLGMVEFATQHPFLLTFTHHPYILHVPSLIGGLVLLILLPWLSERLVAFLFVRKPVGFRVMVRAFRESSIEWFTYNRHEANSVGVFQSPSGTCKQRYRMTFATVLLFSCLIAQLPNPALPFWKESGGQGLWDFDKTRFGPQTHRHDGPTIRLVSYQPEGQGTFEPDMPKLEKYQERHIRRLSPERRKEYLDRLRREQAAIREAEAREEEAKAAQLKANEETPTSDGKRNFNSPFHLYRIRVLGFISGVNWFLVPTLLITLPTLFFFVGCFTTSARVAGFWSQEFRTDSGKRLLNTETWDDLVTRVRASKDKIENESLLLGVNAHDNSPVIVPRSVFHEHAHLLGDSGSGKTSLGIASLMTQLIRFGDSTVVIIDLKGDDLALFEGARIEAERAGLRFRWFTNKLGRDTFVFNPLTQSHLSGLTLNQRTDVFTAALGLQYGTDYGRSYYSDANAKLLNESFKARPGVKSFRELAEMLGDKHTLRGVSSDIKEAGSHLPTVIDRLADLEALNAAGNEPSEAGALANAIDMTEMFKTPQVLYFHLSSAIGSTSTAEIARLALYSLLTAATTTGEARTQVYLFIDEFQRIVSGNLEIFLQQARSMNIGVILANQGLGDLKTAGVDLVPTVRSNTRYRQIFAASDLAEQEDVIKTSGESVVYARSLTKYLGTVTGATGSLGISETVTPRLRVNDILMATDHPNQSIVHIRRGKGYAQYGGLPFVMTSAFHISNEEYELSLIHI